MRRADGVVALAVMSETSALSDAEETRFCEPSPTPRGGVPFIVGCAGRGRPACLRARPAGARARGRRGPRPRAAVAPRRRLAPGLLRARREERTATRDPGRAKRDRGAHPGQRPARKAQPVADWRAQAIPRCGSTSRVCKRGRVGHLRPKGSIPTPWRQSSDLGAQKSADDGALSSFSW